MPWFKALTIASICGYSVIALAIYCNRSLQAHPMNLIFYISMVDAALCCNIYASYDVCHWGLYKLFAWSVLWSDAIDY